MGRGLVGDDVEPLAGRRPGGLDLGGVADERDRLGGSPAAAASRAQRERLGRVVGQPVDVADVEPAARPRLVDLDGEADALVHRHGQRLGAAHPAEAGGQRHASRAASRRSAGGPARRTSRTCPGGSPGSRCRSTTRRSSGRTSSGPACSSSRKTLPGRPLADEVRVGDQDPRRPLVGPERRRPACPTGRAASRRRRARAARGRSRRRRPSDRAARPVPP